MRWSGVFVPKLEPSQHASGWRHLFLLFFKSRGREGIKKRKKKIGSDAVRVPSNGGYLPALAFPDSFSHSTAAGPFDPCASNVVLPRPNSSRVQRLAF